MSADGEAWFLLNASPEIRAQIEAFPALRPQRLRDSPIAGILLTNGDLDHTLGLLCLRESHPLVVYATEAVRQLLHWAAANTDFQRLEVLVSVENAPSLRVAEKSGAIREGVLRSRILLHGRFHDAVVVGRPDGTGPQQPRPLDVEDQPAHPPPPHDRGAEQRRLGRVERVLVAKNLVDERGQLLHGRARDNRLRHNRQPRWTGHERVRIPPRAR